ncbi:MAG: type 4a pilus biogenesis protein PilO [bacterium]|nr:type 4a pilus biogenesis protein PilO [bacterium]
MRREQAEQLVLTVIVGAAVLVTVYYTVLQPQWVKLRKMEEEGEQVASALAKAERTLQNLPRLKAACRRMEQQIARAGEQMVGDGSFDSFVGVIKANADAAGVALQYVRPRETVPVVEQGRSYEEHIIVVDTRAPYHGLGAWIAGLEGTSPYVRIHAVTVSGSGEGGGGHPASVTIGFLTPRGKR